MSKTEKLVTFVAVFVSLLALTVSIFQTRIMQKQAAAAVWPKLDSGMNWGMDYFNVDIVNDGVGPAVVKNIKYINQDSSFYRITGLINYFKRKEEKELDQPFLIDFGYSDIDIDIDYCSIYEDCWKLRNDLVTEL